jgi:hypothetical protein
MRPILSKAALAVLGASAVLVAPLAAGAVVPSGVSPDGGTASTLGAGYLGSPPSGTAVAETSFRVPTITCAHHNDTETLWLGLQAYKNAGGVNPDNLYAQVKASCDAGVISYTAYVNANGNFASMAVNPGDLIDTYYRQSSTATVAAVYNLTKGPQISEVGDGLTSFSVLEGQQDLTSVVPGFTDNVTGLAEVVFTGSWVNGYLQRYDGYPTLQLKQKNLHVEIGTTGLSNNKSGFKLLFKSHY